MARVTRSSARLASGKSKPAEPVAKKPTIAKPKITKKPDKPKPAKVAAAAATNDSNVSKTIVSIEHCKSWGAFRTRAAKLQKAVGSKAKVEINKEKPGKGNFIVTVTVGEDETQTIVDLQGLKRPFPALKALDMDEVIGNLVEAIGDQK